MNKRQIVILSIALICFAVAGVRIAKMGGGPKIKKSGSPEDIIQLWTCREDGFTTNVSLAEIYAQIDAGMVRPDPTYPAESLLKCPKCGKFTFEQAGRSGETGGQP